MAELSIPELIRKAAVSRGVDPEVALRIAERESSLDPTAKNRRSSAYGLFQVTDDTWKQYGGDPAKRRDLQENLRVGLDVISSNRDTFIRQFGREPAPGELYTMHFLGRTGGPKLLSADPSLPVASVVSPRVLKANPEIKGKTVGEFIASMQQKMAAPKAPATAVATSEGPVSMPASPKETMQRPQRPRIEPLAEGPLTRDMLANLGPNYQAALAAVTLGDSRDDEDEESLSEQYAARQEEDEGVPRSAALASLDLSYQSPFAEPVQQFRDGGMAETLPPELQPTFGQRMGAAASDLITKGLINAYDVAATDRSKMSAAHKIYLDTFGTKENRGPITKDYFSPEEMSAISDLIARKGGGPKGAITYEDYIELNKTRPIQKYPGGVFTGRMDPYHSVNKALGQFGYEYDPKTKQYKILDEYDFNFAVRTPEGQRLPDDFAGDYIADDLTDVYSIARKYGGRKMPPGTGRKVDLAVPAKAPVKRADGSPVYGEIADTGPITADTRRALSLPQGLSAAELMRMLKGVGREGVSNLESLARGSVSAVPGLVGDVESIFRSDKERRFATTPEVERQYLPKRMTAPTKESAGFVELGTFIDPTIAGKVARPVAQGTAKAMMAGVKAAGPQIEATLSKMAPAAQPFSIMRTSGGFFPSSKTYTETPISSLDEHIKDTVKWQNLAEDGSPERAATLKFLDTKVRNYFRTQAGSVSDPVREGLIAGRIKIPKDSPLEEMYPTALINAARAGDVTAMRQLERQFDEDLAIKAIKVGPEKLPEGRTVSAERAEFSEEFGQSILEQMKRNPQLIPDEMLLRLTKKDVGKLTSTQAKDKVAEIRKKLADNPTLFNTVFEEKILRMFSKDPTRYITPQDFEQYPSLYGNLKEAVSRQEGIMALQQGAPFLDVEGWPKILGQSFKDIATYAQMIPAAELERMDVPEAINRIIQLKRANDGVESMVRKTESLVSAGKPVPENISTFGTKVVIPADDKGFVWREITDPAATKVQAKMLGNSIAGYSLPGTYGKLERGAAALTSGDVRLFGLYDKNNQLMTNVEYITSTAKGKPIDEGKVAPNSITQFFGNGPKTGNVAPEDFGPQVVSLVNFLNPTSIPPSIRGILKEQGAFFPAAF